MKLKNLLQKRRKEGGWLVTDGGKIKGSEIGTIESVVKSFKKLGIYETWIVYKLSENEYAICKPNQEKDSSNYYIIKFIKHTQIT